MKLPDLTQGLEIPSTLRATVQRHQANFAELACNLHSAGISAVQIEESINMLLETYRTVLVSALRVEQRWQ